MELQRKMQESAETDHKLEYSLYVATQITCFTWNMPYGKCISFVFVCLTEYLYATITVNTISAIMTVSLSFKNLQFLQWLKTKKKKYRQLIRAIDV